MHALAGKRSLRVAVVQFSPVIGKVQDNIKKADRICSSLQPDSVDLVCLPEMIFTGYVFPNAQAILPYLEKPKSGPTSVFCQTLSQRLHCYVAAGYPEWIPPEEHGFRDDGSEMVGANSAVLYGPDGECVGSYRKSNMYETDKTWAEPGDGFRTFSLPEPLGALTIAICMDLNPFPDTEWTFDEGPFELAAYCRSTDGKPRTKTLLLLNAWLDSGTDEGDRWDDQVLGYWCSRLRPLWAGDGRFTDSDSDDAASSASDHDTAEETAVIICNRCGEENGVRFAGTSTVMKMYRGDYDIVGRMQRREEGLRIWTV